MPTKKPRITISIKPETKEIFDRLTAASGIPASTFIAEMLEEAAPALFEPMIEVMTMARSKKTEAYDLLNSVLSKTQYNAAQLTLAIHEEKRKEAVKKTTKRGKNAAKN